MSIVRHGAGVNVSLTSNSTPGLRSVASYSFEPSLSPLYSTHPVLKLRTELWTLQGSSPPSVKEY